MDRSIGVRACGSTCDFLSGFVLDQARKSFERQGENWCQKLPREPHCREGSGAEPATWRKEVVPAPIHPPAPACTCSTFPKCLFHAVDAGMYVRLHPSLPLSGGKIRHVQVFSRGEGCALEKAECQLDGLDPETTFTLIRFLPLGEKTPSSMSSPSRPNRRTFVAPPL